MPSKKKKYNARFPAGRIKKIMQSDEEVGKVAQAVPIIISRTLELFVESLLNKTLRITSARNAKTLSPSHMRQCIMTENRFDFLRELVKNLPDISVADEQQQQQQQQQQQSAQSSSAAASSSTSTMHPHPAAHLSIDDYDANATTTSTTSSNGSATPLVINEPPAATFDLTLSASASAFTLSAPPATPTTSAMAIQPTRSNVSIPANYYTEIDQSARPFNGFHATSSSSASSAPTSASTSYGLHPTNVHRSQSQTPTANYYLESVTQPQQEQPINLTPAANASQPAHFSANDPKVDVDMTPIVKIDYSQMQFGYPSVVVNVAGGSHRQMIAPNGGNIDAAPVAASNNVSINPPVARRGRPPKIRPPIGDATTSSSPSPRQSNYLQRRQQQHKQLQRSASEYGQKATASSSTSSSVVDKYQKPSSSSSSSASSAAANKSLRRSTSSTSLGSSTRHQQQQHHHDNEGQRTSASSSSASSSPTSASQSLSATTTAVSPLDAASLQPPPPAMLSLMASSSLTMPTPAASIVDMDEDYDNL